METDRRSGPLAPGVVPGNHKSYHGGVTNRYRTRVLFLP